MRSVEKGDAFYCGFQATAVASKTETSFLSLGYVLHVRLVAFCVPKYRISWYRCDMITCILFASVRSNMVL